ncbi:hypothetical protein SNE40_013093 [Patella caerulea]|uniref:Uncharacterized protein n=1 Tax=Patella caerulea TaxID=87958 RepID=A0AAN8PWJ0_PATCE
MTPLKILCLKRDFLVIPLPKYSEHKYCTILVGQDLIQFYWSLEKSAIHFLPVIPASPSVNTILKKSIELADRLVLVFDPAIYSKAQQIRWKDENISKRTVIRLGEFHKR